MAYFIFFIQSNIPDFVVLNRCGEGVKLAEAFGAGPGWPAGPSLNSMIVS